MGMRFCFVANSPSPEASGAAVVTGKERGIAALDEL